METKSIFVSKVFWTNVIGILGMTLQTFTGKEVIPMEYQASILACINIILRLVTKSAVTWN